MSADGLGKLTRRQLKAMRELDAAVMDENSSSDLNSDSKGKKAAVPNCSHKGSSSTKAGTVEEGSSTTVKVEKQTDDRFNEDAKTGNHGILSVDPEIVPLMPNGYLFINNPLLSGGGGDPSYIGTDDLTRTPCIRRDNEIGTQTHLSDGRRHISFSAIDPSSPATQNRCVRGSTLMQFHKTRHPRALGIRPSSPTDGVAGDYDAHDSWYAGYMMGHYMSAGGGSRAAAADLDSCLPNLNWTAPEDLLPGYNEIPNWIADERKEDCTPVIGGGGGGGDGAISPSLPPSLAGMGGHHSDPIIFPISTEYPEHHHDGAGAGDVKNGSNYGVSEDFGQDGPGEINATTSNAAWARKLPPGGVYMSKHGSGSTIESVARSFAGLMSYSERPFHSPSPYRTDNTPAPPGVATSAAVNAPARTDPFEHQHQHRHKSDSPKTYHVYGHRNLVYIVDQGVSVLGNGNSTTVQAQTEPKADVQDECSCMSSIGNRQMGLARRREGGIHGGCAGREGVSNPPLHRPYHEHYFCPPRGVQESQFVVAACTGMPGQERTTDVSRSREGEEERAWEFPQHQVRYPGRFEVHAENADVKNDSRAGGCGDVYGRVNTSIPAKSVRTSTGVGAAMDRAFSSQAQGQAEAAQYYDVGPPLNPAPPINPAVGLGRAVPPEDSGVNRGAEEEMVPDGGEGVPVQKSDPRHSVDSDQCRPCCHFSFKTSSKGESSTVTVKERKQSRRKSWKCGFC